jgi:ribosomal-protein-alanine N-acetyltransferase
MPIVPATPTHLTAIKYLLDHGAYRYVDLGAEDLPTLVQRGPNAVGEDGGNIWGFLGIQVEERPPTMPADAPTRAYLRGVALARGRRPAVDVAQLLAAVTPQLPALAGSNGAAVQMLAYGTEWWLSAALFTAGFVEVEAVQFYQLDRLRVRRERLPPSVPGVHFSPGRPDYLDTLAALDAAAFPPLWHFGRRDLFEMLMRCRVQLAWWDSRLAGYTALCANSRREGQLARIAVHPELQGYGIGRALLTDAVQYTADYYNVLILNTQTTNDRAQRLYRSFGFTPLGAPVAVLARQQISPA